MVGTEFECRVHVALPIKQFKGVQPRTAKILVVLGSAKQTTGAKSLLF